MNFKKFLIFILLLTCVTALQISRIEKTIPAGGYLVDSEDDNKFNPVLKHDDLYFIKDTSAGASKILGHDGSTYDYHEELALDYTFSGTSPYHIDSTSSRANQVKTYNGDVRLFVKNTRLRYLLVFDDSLDKNGDGEICTPGTNEENLFPLKGITFLGKKLEIDCTNFDGEMPISIGTEHTIISKQNITYEDYETTVNVEINGLEVKVTKGENSETISVSEGQIDCALGLCVECKSIFRSASGNRATIRVGESLSDNVSDGEDFVSGENWRWIIDKGKDGKPIIGIEYYNPSNNGEVMLSEGEKISTPGNQIFLKNKKVTNSQARIFVGKAVCGDGVCELNENHENCCYDCGCEEGEYCLTNMCVNKPAYTCGNGECEKGETSSTCCQDCGCEGKCETSQEVHLVLLKDNRGSDFTLEEGTPRIMREIEFTLTGIDTRSGVDQISISYEYEGKSENIILTKKELENLGEIGFIRYDYREERGECEAQSICGNGECENGETPENCPQDCDLCTTKRFADVTVEINNELETLTLEEAEKITIQNATLELKGIDTRAPNKKCAITVYTQEGEEELIIIEQNQANTAKGVTINFIDYETQEICQCISPCKCMKENAAIKECGLLCEETPCGVNHKTGEKKFCYTIGCTECPEEYSCISKGEAGTRTCSGKYGSTPCKVTNEGEAHYCYKCQEVAEAICGDGKCENGETSDSCCQDCGCPEGRVCENNQCVTKKVEEEKTIIKETGEPEPSPTPTEECETDEDCDDNNACTTDICYSNKCSHTEIDGCEHMNSCVGLGHRAIINRTRSYCSITNEWKPQLEEGASCTNNYQCKTNLCSEGKCTSITGLSKLMKTLITLLERLLGR